MLLSIKVQGIFITNAPPSGPPPPNDNFTNAIELPSTCLHCVVNHSNVGETIEPGEPSIGWSTYPSMWWKWTPTRASVATLRDNWSKMAVFRGDSLTNLELIIWGGPGPYIYLDSEPLHFGYEGLVFTNEANVTYWIADITGADPFAVRTNTSFVLGQKLQWVESAPTSVGKLAPFKLVGTDEIPWPTSLNVRLDLRSYSGSKDIWTTVVDTNLANPLGQFWQWIPDQIGQYSVTVTATYASGDRWKTIDLIEVNGRNDLIEDAELIPADFQTGILPFQTLFANSSENEPAPGTNYLYRTVWWKWTPDHDAHLRVYARASIDGGVLVDVFTRDDQSNLVRVANNDWNARKPIWKGYAGLQVQAGHTYSIRVNDDVGTLTGSLVFEPYDAPSVGAISLSTAAPKILPDGTTQWEILGKVYLPDGSLAAGKAYAGFFVGKTRESMRQMGSFVVRGGPYDTFSPPEFAGAVVQGDIPIPGLNHGDEVLVQLRAWASNFYNYSYALQQDAPIGRSQIVKVIAGSELDGVTVLYGLGDVHIQSAAAPFEPATLSSNNATDPSIQIRGLTGLYAVDASDLRGSWQFIGYATNQIGTIEFKDTRPDRGSALFYRSRFLD
jgi:hypothetical protein